MKLRLVLVLLGICLPFAATATTVYRSTDAQGNVVFSDQPDQGAEPVELEPLTVVPSLEPDVVAPAGESRAGAPRSDTAAPFMPYSVFRIASPSNEETLPTGYAGNVQVELRIEPELREDHQVRLLLDGEVSQSAMHTSAFMLTNLERGEHVLQAELLDTSGEVRHRSAPVTLYVQRASVNLPQNPN
ncbi:DUF4124 domain-containing protein [Litchfieldella rifensis]|uniref:DUF4124 domain-containing protein n=1 Tax=Litchfieldella rifensis TaxID=762643 RepID=A0ABV7LPN7_9GAMM